jgi:hypothetical protein
MREVGNGWCCCCPGWCAQCVDQRMVVFSAVEERDLRLENSDACRARLGRLRAIVMCIRESCGCRSVHCVCLLLGPDGRTMRRIVMPSGGWRRMHSVEGE